MSEPHSQPEAAPTAEAVRRHLLAIRAHIFAEMRETPSPIPACDQRFNHLIEQRNRIAAELQRLDALLEQAAPGGQPAPAALEAFIAASPFIDEEAATRLREGLTPAGTGQEPTAAAAR